MFHFLVGYPVHIGFQEPQFTRQTKLDNNGLGTCCKVNKNMTSANPGVKKQGGREWLKKFCVNTCGFKDTHDKPELPFINISVCVGCLR